MNVTVPDVIGALFNPTDTVCFRIFDDKKGGLFKGSKLSCECGKYKSIEEIEGRGRLLLARAL